MKRIILLRSEYHRLPHGLNAAKESQAVEPVPSSSSTGKPKNSKDEKKKPEKKDHGKKSPPKPKKSKDEKKKPEKKDDGKKKEKQEKEKDKSKENGGAKQNETSYGKAKKAFSEQPLGFKVQLVLQNCYLKIHGNWVSGPYDSVCKKTHTKYAYKHM